MEKRKKKKKKLTLWPLLIFGFGIGIILYPTVSNYYMVLHQSGAIMEFTENLSALDNEEGQQIWADAVEYNRLLYLSQEGEDLPEDALQNYDDVLHVAENGMMGYINIPKIKVHLPIYHGTSDPVLQKGIGHWEISSFPVGGENTHSILTGHTGLPSARLFTDLDQMEVGDVFTMQIIGETLTYQVEEILIVLPYEIESLAIFEGQDLCTLVTCTPYGVNSHRLLVRGHRIENAQEEETEITPEQEAEQNARMPMLKVIAIAAGCVLLLLLILLWGTGKKRKKKKTDENPAPEGNSGEEEESKETGKDGGQEPKTE